MSTTSPRARQISHQPPGRTASAPPHAGPMPASALEAARKVLMSQFAVGDDVFIDDRRALDAVELYWHSLSDAQRWELSRELTAAGYYHVVRRDALIAWARERLHPDRTCGRNPRGGWGSSRVSPWIVASAGLPSLGKRR